MRGHRSDKIEAPGCLPRRLTAAPEGREDETKAMGKSVRQPPRSEALTNILTNTNHAKKIDPSKGPSVAKSITNAFFRAQPDKKFCLIYDA
jgi:hypothetical protein